MATASSTVGTSEMSMLRFSPLLAELGAARIGLQVAQTASEHRRLVVGAVGLVDKIEIHAPLLKHHTLYAETLCEATQTRYTQQLGSNARNLSETVLEAQTELLQVELALYAVELLVERYALALLRHIFGREQQLEVALHRTVGHELVGGILAGSVGRVGEHVGEFLGLQFEHGLAQYALIGLVAEVGDESRLLGSEEIASATDIKVLHGDMYAAAQFAEALDSLQTASRHGGKRIAGRHKQIAERLARRAPYPALAADAAR